MSKKISNEIKNNVVLLHQQGISNVLIARKEKIGITSVRRILIEKGNLQSTLIGGRPKKLKKREINMLIRGFTNGTLENTSNCVKLIKEVTNKNVSNSMIRKMIFRITGSSKNH